MWITPADMRAVITDEFIERLALGNDGVAALVGAIRDDLDRYLRLLAKS
jgi:hypothetical protein